MKPDSKKSIKTNMNILLGLLFPLIFVYRKNQIPIPQIENKTMKFIALYLWLPVSAIIRWLIILLPYLILF